MAPLIVLVSGCPGAGKTTLARPLAEELGLTLVCKDDIKEALFDALGGPQDDLAYSRQLGVVAWEVIWALAQANPRLVVEANFRPGSAYERGRIEALSRRVIEVHCACPPHVAQARYMARAQTAARHPVHALRTLSAADVADFQGPIGIGEVVVADTNAPVDPRAIAHKVDGLLATPPCGNPGRKLALMTGYPASGKSTLARSLARNLQFGYVSKDEIRELIFDAMGFRAGDHEASLATGQAAWAIFWMMAHRGRDLVLDSNIKPMDPYELAQAQAISGLVAEIHCRCPSTLAQQRYFDRQTASGHGSIRTVHLTDERLALYEGSLGLKHRIEVDTSGPVETQAVIRVLQETLGLDGRKARIPQ
jgi:predicted kinase